METEVRSARVDDLDAILQVEESAWDEEQRAGAEQWVSRIRTFGEGTLVATVAGEVMGLLSTEIIADYDFEHGALTWYEVTDNGFIRNTHVSDGRYLYGVDLSVARGAPASVPTALLVAAGDLTVRRDLEGILLGGRIPGYHRVADEMSAHDYIFGTRGSGRPLDPEIYMYSKYSVRPLKALPDYFHDPESLDYGVLLYWSNPFRARTRDEMEFSLAPLAELFSTVCQRHQGDLGVTTCLHLELPGAGCTWAKRTGGCSMCSFSTAATSYSHGRLLPDELFESMYRVARDSASREHPRVLTVFNGGSFLNPLEIPPEFQAFLASEVGNDSDLEMLYVETRAEYVTSDSVASVVSRLGPKRLALGIGLESVSDRVRNDFVRKGLTLDEYRRALKVAHDNGAIVRTYVLLKPPGLTDAQAIQEAVSTIRAAFEMGTDEVSLEASFVAPGSPLENLFVDGAYRPPSLWSVVEVLRQTDGLGCIHLGQFTDKPPPIAVPEGCPECSEALLEALDRYRNSMSPAVFDVLSDCECRHLG